MAIPHSIHQHYSVVVALGESLRKTLIGAKLKDTYTLSKEELVLVFELPQSSFFTIQITQQFQSCFTWFQYTQPVKGSNAQPCFESIIGLPVLGIEQHEHNRSFAFKVSPNQQLVFKWYDSLVNVLLFEDGKVTDLFRKNITNDWELTLNDFKGTVTTMVEPVTKLYVYKRSHAQHPYYVTSQAQPDELIKQSSDVLEILSVFSGMAFAHYRFAAQKQQITAQHQSLLHKLTSTEHITQAALLAKEKGVSHEETANILMANLHAIPDGLERVELFDFYRNQPIVIKLKATLNAQQNAAYYYRKHKNSKIELQQLEQKLAATQQRIAKLEQELRKVEQTASYKELKVFVPKENKSAPKVFPFKQFECEGFDIWVGKSAANNDELTMRHSHKNDLWLHAKDVSGSHVLVKWKPGKDFPKSVVKRAAQLAAYYSKLSGSNMVPVAYTLKKFVRKPKGAEPGKVAVDKEEVILVEPIL